MKDTVPDFEIDDDYSIPSSSVSGGHGGSGLTRPKKNPIGDDEDIMELLWQNGQLVLQSQNHRPFKKSPNGGGGGGGRGEGEGVAELTQSISTTRDIRSFDNVINMSNHNQQQQQLFMQEDEMASWLHYPMSIDDSSFVDHRELYHDDLLYTPPSAPAIPSSPPRQIHSVVTEIRPLTPPPLMATSVSTISPRPPPIPPPPATEAAAAQSARFQNFTYFSRLPKATRIDQSGPSTSTRELTVVNSNETPMMGTESRISRRVEEDSGTQLYSSENVRCGSMSMTMTASVTAAGTSTTACGLTGACEATVTSSSPGASGGSASASAEPPPLTVHKPSTSATDDRKRKREETEDTECLSEDIEFVSVDVKKETRGFRSTKRSRAAEVHNLSERRRRDRINERMKALQELIPRCNKSDKASMLDEAIEYLKSLQLQVQMMSMGCGMLPMMYPGVQQYMPVMGMGMGMGMEMGMNRRIMPYPSLIPPSGMPNPAVVPAFHMRPVAVPGSSRVLGSNQLDPMLNSQVAQNPNQPRMPNFGDPYQQFIGLHQAQVPLQQNQVVVQPNKPSSSSGAGNPENHRSG